MPKDKYSAIANRATRRQLKKLRIAPDGGKAKNKGKKSGNNNDSKSKKSKDKPKTGR